MTAEKTRALRVYEKMGDIGDRYILDAEIPAEILPVPVPRFGGLRRFLNSGWGAALISGIVALSVLAFIIRAGQNPPVEPPPPANSSGETTAPVLDYPPAQEQPYTIYVPDVSYSNHRIPVTVTAKEKGQSLDAPFRNWKIVKLMGTSDPHQADWYYSAEEVGAVLPSEENDGYAVYQEELTVYAWNRGVYRIYALNENGEYVDYCDFAFFADNPLPFELYWVSNGRVPTSRNTHLEVLFQSKYRGQTVDCEIQWSIYRIENDPETKILIGTSESMRLYIPSTDPDEFVTKTVLLSIEQATGGSAVTLPSYDVVYELDLHYKTDSGEIYDFPIIFAVHDNE